MLSRARGVALVLAAFGCAPKDTTHPPPPPDCDDNCNPPPAGGGPGGGTGGGTGGGGGTGPGGSAGRPDATIPPPVDAGEAVVVSYNVQQTVDTWFFATSTYSGAVKVRAVGPTGQLTPAEDAGATGPNMVPGVIPGPNWFLIEDATTARRIVSTLELVNVDQAGFYSLRAIAGDGIANLVVDQVLWTPPAGTATIILNFRKGQLGARGVTVKRDALPAGTTVAYDSSGMYVSDAMVIGTAPATEGEGVAIVREIAGTQPFPALTSVTLRYQLANNTSSFPAIEAKIARDVVTWIRVDLP